MNHKEFLLVSSILFSIFVLLFPKFFVMLFKYRILCNTCNQRSNEHTVIGDCETFLFCHDSIFAFIWNHSQRRSYILWLIKCQICHRIETSQFIYSQINRLVSIMTNFMSWLLHGSSTSVQYALLRKLCR